MLLVYLYGWPRTTYLCVVTLNPDATTSTIPLPNGSPQLDWGFHLLHPEGVALDNPQVRSA